MNTSTHPVGTARSSGTAGTVTLVLGGIPVALVAELG
jgi:hypothetical protein